LTAFKKLHALREFCLSLKDDISDEVWNKVASLPREEWTEDSVRAVVLGKKPKKKVTSNAEEK